MSSENVILIKVGEIWLKGKNRSDFMNRLVLNIQNVTRVSRKDIRLSQGRIYITKFKVKSSKLKVLENLKTVFGITGFAEAHKIELSMEKAKKVSCEIALEEAEKGASSFKVDARRGFKEFEKNSMEINQEIGETVFEKFSELKVDLHDPDFILHVEVREEGIYIYSSNNEVRGPGGLPVGVSGKGLLMLSGGIDSPVAGWYMQKRGMEVDAVYFHSPPHVGEKTKEKVIDICRILAKWKNTPIKLYVPHFTEIQIKTLKDAPSSYATILHRRFMVKITQKLAKDNAYNAMISGESLGQVASQTVENISAIGGGMDMQILRPLIGFDKQEIVDIAKSIETYKISILPYDDCCTVFASRNPKTKVSRETFLEIEKKFDFDYLINRALDKMEIFIVHSDKIEKIK